jgi:hypothetical protein
MKDLLKNIKSVERPKDITLSDAEAEDSEKR